jgi:hypothetical protein
LTPARVTITPMWSGGDDAGSDSQDCGDGAGGRACRAATGDVVVPEGCCVARVAPSSLIRCRFAGKLDAVIFDGRMLGDEKPDPNPMLDVDLSATVINACDFRAIDFSRVSLPADGDLFLVTDEEVLARALSLIPEDDEAAEFVRVILDIGMKWIQEGRVRCSTCEILASPQSCAGRA